MRESVKWFASEMERILRENNHRSTWEEMSASELFSELNDEVVELEDQFFWGEPEDVIGKCVDIANCAMTIADNMRRRHGIDDKK